MDGSWISVLPRVMGVINVTPDSFFPGAVRIMKKISLGLQKQCCRMVQRSWMSVATLPAPGAADVSPEVESERVTTAIRAIIRRFPEAIISVDTFRSSVAAHAVAEGALLINDVSGGTLDPQMHQIVGTLGVPYILMHMRGTPQTMTSHTEYRNMAKEIADYFQEKSMHFRHCT